MIFWIAIAVGSVLVVWVSRRSLLHPASHGFARFFAFEAILVLIVLNAPHWFSDPLGARQLVSWLLIASAVLVVWGVVLLRRLGRPRPATGGASRSGGGDRSRAAADASSRTAAHSRPHSPADGSPPAAAGPWPPEPARESSDFEWERTERLVTTGIYRTVRHPMYSSLLLLTWGALLKSVSVSALMLALIATAALYATARLEERENVDRFGQSYRDYMAKTRRFIPYVL